MGLVRSGDTLAGGEAGGKGWLEVPRRHAGRMGLASALLLWPVSVLGWVERPTPRVSTSHVEVRVPYRAESLGFSGGPLLFRVFLLRVALFTFDQAVARLDRPLQSF